jgi:TIR domain
MARIEKTVFVSYRRADESWGLAIFQDLTQRGYDVFIDYDGIASGNFEAVILENIRARAHFLVLLTPTALERCGDPKDWMRREIEAALDSQRNIVPVMLAGFDFGTPATASQLTGKLAVLKEYNGLEIPRGYFSPAMERLRNKFLSISLDTVLHPASLSAQQAATEQKGKAARALADEHRKGEDEQPRNAAQAKAARQAREEERKREEEANARRNAEEERHQREAEAKRQADEQQKQEQEERLLRETQAKRRAEDEERQGIAERKKQAQEERVRREADRAEQRRREKEERNRHEQQARELLATRKADEEREKLLTKLQPVKLGALPKAEPVIDHIEPRSRIIPSYGSFRTPSRIALAVLGVLLMSSFLFALFVVPLIIGAPRSSLWPLEFFCLGGSVVNCLVGLDMITRPQRIPLSLLFKIGFASYGVFVVIGIYLYLEQSAIYQHFGLAGSFFLWSSIPYFLVYLAIFVVVYRANRVLGRA